MKPLPRKGELCSMRNFLIALILILPLEVCNAQSPSTKPVEPTKIDVAYLLDPATKELKELPYELQKGNGLKFFGTQYVVVSHSQSSFRVKAGDPTLFVFKSPIPERVCLYSFEVVNKKRQFAYATISGHFGATLIKGLPIEVSQFAGKIYKVVPASPLAPVSMRSELVAGFTRLELTNNSNAI
jgi:hypothetical protein